MDMSRSIAQNDTEQRNKQKLIFVGCHLPKDLNDLRSQYIKLLNICLLI